jgi:signal transduction histidine kinase
MTSNPATYNVPELFPIRRTLLYIEWTVIGSAAIVMMFNVRGQSVLSETQQITLTIVSLCLSSCIWLSLFFPIDCPLWQRRAYVALEILVLLPTRTLTDCEFQLLLFFFLAKSCFLLSRKDVILTVIATGIAWQSGVAWYISEQPIQSLRVSGPRVSQSLEHPEKYKEQILMARIINDTGTYIGAGTFVVLFSFSLLSEQESRKRAMALTHQIEVLSATLERTRIARDIHDSLGHTLTTLDVQLELSQRAYEDHPKQALQALNTAKDLASQSLAEVRCALRTMHEKNFDLHQALLTLTERVQQGQSFEIHLDTNLPELPPQVGYQIYRVIQEGLTNIQKHAQASSVYIGSKVTKDHLTLELVDDGEGFNVQASHTGFGLRGMRERAMLLKGQLDIESVPGQGTRIHLTIPL